jgi:hypothetical protein
MNDAEKMREKQRLADNKKNGIVEEDEGPVDDPLPQGEMGWKCAFTGNFMFTDGYPMSEIYEGMVM